MNVPTITACLLTRDSERTIRQAIESVRPHVDQVLVVDTGSADRTIEIARRLGCRVLPFVWQDDFAAARNFAIEQADGAWIFFLDSDETFHWHHPQISLREFLADESSFAGVYVITCLNVEESDGKVLLQSHAERLFPRGRFVYQGAIHEVLTGTGKQLRLLASGEIVHTGYSEVSMQEKKERNLRLLQRELAIRPQDGRLHRYLAGEWFNRERFDECITHCRVALERLPEQEAYSRAQCYYYWMMSLLSMGAYAGCSRVARKARAEIPMYADPYAVEFELAVARRDVQTAVSMFERWDVLSAQAQLLPQHLTGSFDKLKFKYEQISKSHHEEKVGSDLVKLTVAVFGVQHRQDVNAIERQMEMLPFVPDVVFVAERWESDVKRVILDHGFQVWEGSKRSRQELQQAILEKASGEWVLFWEAEDRFADPDAFAAWFAEAQKEQASAYAATVTYRTDRLQVSGTQVRLIRKKVPLAAGLAGVVTTEAFAVQSRFLRVKTDGVGVDLYDPFFIADLAQHRLSQEERVLREAISLFAGQAYVAACERLGAFPLPLPDAVEVTEERLWQARTQAFLLVLCHINGGQTHAALEVLQDVINDDHALAKPDFCYLYAKMVTAIDDPEIKEEAVQLLEECRREYAEPPACFLQISEEDVQILLGDLYDQLHRFAQARSYYVDAIRQSGLRNERAAYRLAQGIAAEAQKQSRMHDLPRLLIEEMERAAMGGDTNAEMKRLLYLQFRELGLDDWAILYYPFHESVRYGKTDSKVSVILPVYNQGMYLRDAIRSVLLQTHCQFELIIVDDGSEPDIREIVEEFWYDRRVKYVRLEQNGGLPAALNAGLAEADGDYLLWTSADNLLHETLLERLAGALAADETKVAAVANYRHIDEIGAPLEKRLLHAYELNGLSAPGPALMWRAETMRRIGTFDTELYGIEDRDFAVRLRMEGEFAHVPEELYSYRIHDDSLSAAIEQGRFGGWERLHAQLKAKWFYWSFI